MPDKWLLEKEANNVHFKITEPQISTKVRQINRWRKCFWGGSFYLCKVKNGFI